MTHSPTRISAAVLDSDNPRALAAFYEKLLGWTTTVSEPARPGAAPTDGWVMLKPPTGGTGLSFQFEPGYVAPTWPATAHDQQMMVHLDIAVEDLDAGVAASKDLGATLADYQPQEGVRVMLDPAGHPFCLFVGGDGDGRDWSAGAAYMDGAFCPINEAKISVLDMGMTRSDCTYDVVSVWDGRFFRLDAHIERFLHSVARLRLDIGMTDEALEAVLHECVSRAGLQRAFVSMTCTRGRPAPGSRDLRTCRNNFYCFAVPYIWVSSEEQQAVGASMWISEIPRIPPESVDPSVKNYHWLDLDMAQFDAYDHDAQMVVLRDLSGAITEGPGYNIFAFVDGRWLTPATGTLMGVTRQTLIELCSESGSPAEQGRMSADDLMRADEVLTCTTAGGVMPVTRLNGEPIGDGLVGPRTSELRDRYWKLHVDPALTTPVRYTSH